MKLQYRIVLIEYLFEKVVEIAILNYIDKMFNFGEGDVDKVKGCRSIFFLNLYFTI